MDPVAAWPGRQQSWPPPTVVVVMAEWTDTFLWNRSPRQDPSVPSAYDLDPDVLGVSPRLTARLRAWNDRYGADAPTPAWAREGWGLARDLQWEFDRRGLDVVVVFHSENGDERPVRDGGARP